MIRDPAGLVHRIPELKPLCEDPAVLRAVEQGDPFRLYRTLRWARWLGRLRSHRETIDTLLRHRRLFARPIKGTPSMGTVTGFGATLLGKSEPDSHDGTHIATHCVVAIFVLPLLPLGAYVARPSEGGGAFNRGWTLFARVPMGPLPWLWSRALALGVMALVALGAAQALRDSRYQDVRVINGFSKPLRAELGGVSQRVPAGGMAFLTHVPTGRQQGRVVTEEGVQVEAIELDVRTGLDVLAWNIAGAAPVYRDVIVYQAESDRSKPPFKPEIFCGRRVIALDNIDYVFREPPSSMQLSRSSSRATRTHVGISPLDTDGSTLCRRVLAAEDRLAEALPFLELAARMEDWEEGATRAAVQVALVQSPEEALRIARRALQDRPEDVELHRHYQWLVERTAPSTRLLEEYRARAEAWPDSASAQYLHARLKRGREGLAAMEQLAQRFPQEPSVLKAVVYGRFLAGDWKGTLKAWEQLRSLSSKAAIVTAQARTTALFALGRRDEALRSLKTLFAEEQESGRDRTAELYAHAARRVEGASPDELIAAIEAAGADEERSPRWDLRVRAGLPVEGAPDWPVLRFMSTVRRDPQAALELVPRLKVADVQALDEAGWALAYGEAVRTGATDVEKVLARAYVLDVESLEVFRRFVRGEAVALEEAELEPEVRAAARFVRSRNAGLPAEERKRLLEQARGDDWFHGAVSEAMTSWTP